jgi:heme-degrading monooxygenase HmoA
MANVIRVGVYRMKREGVGPEIGRRAQEGLLPIFRRQPGFVSYEVVTAPPETALSISTWSSHAAAEAAVSSAADWVHSNLTDLAELTQNYVGDVEFRGEPA